MTLQESKSCCKWKGWSGQVEIFTDFWQIWMLLHEMLDIQLWNSSNKEDLTKTAKKKKKKN